MNLREHHRHSTCVLSDKSPELSHEASRAFIAAPGKLIACAFPIKEKEGNILLSSKFQKARRADVCTVLSAGLGLPFMPGDVVLTAFEQAMRIGKFKSHIYRCPYDVLMFGCNGDACDAEENTTIFAPFLVEWDEYTLMLKENETWVPVGRNVLLEIPEAKKHQGLIELPDAAQRDPLTAIVRGVGPRANYDEDGNKVYNLEEGQEVAYYAKASKKVQTEDGRRFRVVRSEYVYTIVR